MCQNGSRCERILGAGRGTAETERSEMAGRMKRVRPGEPPGRTENAGCLEAVEGTLSRVPLVRARAVGTAPYVGDRASPVREGWRLAGWYISGRWSAPAASSLFASSSPRKCARSSPLLSSLDIHLPVTFRSAPCSASPRPRINRSLHQQTIRG